MTSQQLAETLNLMSDRADSKEIKDIILALKVINNNQARIDDRVTQLERQFNNLYKTVNNRKNSLFGW